MRPTNQTATATPHRWLPNAPIPDTSPARVRNEQKLRGQEACFMTDKRLNCTDLACHLRARCRRLIAVWKR
jgi:hypothetical protein